MATSQTEVESSAIELSAEAFNTFCDDISGMFGLDMECSQGEEYEETAGKLKKHFKFFGPKDVEDCAEYEIFVPEIDILLFEKEEQDTKLLLKQLYLKIRISKKELLYCAHALFFFRIIF